MIVELGKYAAPVLSAWVITLALLAGVVVQTVLANARARRRLAEMERRDG